MKRPETLQDYFDNAWEWFIIKGQPASVGVYRRATACDDMAPIVGCMYRGPNGEKCAIGASIADEDYCPELEGYSPASLIRSLGYPNAGSIEFSKQLRQLQFCHDDASRFETSAWSAQILARLTKFAEAYSLKIPGAKNEEA